jgi:hypothetical protein
VAQNTILTRSCELNCQVKIAVKHPGDEEGHFAEIFRDNFTVEGHSDQRRYILIKIQNYIIKYVTMLTTPA